MSEKILKGRLVQKHDVEANWELATNFIPKQGEIIVYDIDENYNYERMKIGDGKTVVSSLPFIESSKAAIADKATEADHATSADTATKADSATKDANGNIITDIYATKTELDEVSDLVGDTAVSAQINEAISEIPQSDWNQNDETARDYIKNKPQVATPTTVEQAANAAIDTMKKHVDYNNPVFVIPVDDNDETLILQELLLPYAINYDQYFENYIGMDSMHGCGFYVLTDRYIKLLSSGDEAIRIDYKTLLYVSTIDSGWVEDGATCKQYIDILTDDSYGQGLKRYHFTYTVAENDGLYSISNISYTIEDRHNIATEEYVNAAVAGLVDSAPDALNTLNELAAALGDDANFATTVSTQIGQKANASDVANLTTRVGAVESKVGDTPVATQISNAMAQKYAVQVITWEADD